MKRILSISLLTFFLGFFSVSHLAAQDSAPLGKKITKGGKKMGSDIGKGAKKVGAKTAEIASKGKAAVVDKVYEDKVGPSGQKIYINKDAKYYYIDKKGHRRFVAKARLKDKTE